MKISPLTFVPLSFKAIQYKTISPQYEDKKDELKKELEIFTDGRKNAEYLGKGVFSAAYILKQMPNVVVKESFDKKETFQKEQENLELIPESIKNTQKLVARAFDDEKMTYYLLSSKVDGVSPDPRQNPWTRGHLRNMFYTMFQMDKNGFYHGDLNNGNMKLTGDGSVNLIDFQWSHKAKKNDLFKENPKSILPAFIPCENSQMFEMAELPYYLNKMDSKYDAKQFLKTYLQEKSDYHLLRYRFICDEAAYQRTKSDYATIEDAKAFEKAQSAVFQNPNENVLRLESKKIQFLNAFRESYKYIDENVKDKNILSAPAAYLSTLSYIQDFRNEVSNQKTKFFLGANMSKYLKYQEKYGDYWFAKILSWAPDTVKYAIRQTTGRLLPWEQPQIPNKNVDFSQIGVLTDVLSSIDDNYKPVYTKSLGIKNAISESYIDSNLRKVRGVTQFVGSPELDGLKKKACELEDSQVKLKQAYRANQGLEVISYSLLGILKAREFLEVLHNSKSDNKDYILAAKEASNTIMDCCVNMAQDSFQSVFDDIKDTYPLLGDLAGYEGMGHTHEIK